MQRAQLGEEVGEESDKGPGVEISLCVQWTGRKPMDRSKGSKGLNGKT